MDKPDQITSEEILKQSYEHKQKAIERPTQTIQDLDELRSYQLIKRREYEQQLNKNRLNFGQWLRYARWEAQENHDLIRARSIYERALDVNIQHIPFWVQYIQFELTYKAINHARNLLDRATTTLPRVNKLWFLYVQTEETLANYSSVRNIFERWLSWHPDQSAWNAYINFEKRHNQIDNVRQIYIRYVKNFNTQDSWLDWVNFELDLANNIGNIRYVFELSIESLIKSNQPVSDLISKWTDWESSLGEYQRAREIFQLMLTEDKNSIIKLSKDQRILIYNALTKFEKLYGDNDSITSTIATKRKIAYQQTLEHDPFDYDTWWAYLSHLLQQPNSSPGDQFEMAISYIPKDKFKSIRWKRYIFIWIRYCFWEEFTNKNIESARKLWSRCIEVIPHSSFTFGKIWIEYAKFELRNNPHDQLLASRKLLGLSIGKTSQKNPKTKIFKYYISLEQRIGEWSRVRKLYEKWLELLIINGLDWVNVLNEYVSFENSINEDIRCISIYEFGINLQTELKLTNIEPLWYSYIDFCLEEMMYAEVRMIYERLIELSDKPSNWISFALFESSIPSDEQLLEFNQSDLQELEVEITEAHKEATRKVFRQALVHWQELNGDQERIEILNAWKSYEQVNSSLESQKIVEELQPRVTKKVKFIDNVETEFIEYEFPKVDLQPNKKPDFSKFMNLAKKFNMNDKKV